MSNTMPLDVIILNWNAAADTIACLRSVQAWQKIPLRVWVVDNASQADDVESIKRECPRAHLILSEFNRGFAGGNNLALQQVLETECEQVLLLNNDATIDEDSVLVLVQTLHDHPELGIVGPTIWDSDRPQVLLSAGGADIAWHLNSHILDLPPNERIRLVEYVPGTCVMIRSQVLRTVGLLDEDYFFGGELADLCARAQQRGFGSAVDGQAKAFHRVDRSSDLRQSLHIYYVLRNRFLFIRKFHNQKRMRLSAFWIGCSIYLAVLSLAHGQWRRARSILLGLADGLSGNFSGQNERVLWGRTSSPSVRPKR